MKSRNGFVSNSSTSSFLIYGVHSDNEKLDYENIEAIANKFGFKNIEVYCPYDYGGYYFGVSMSGIKYDETVKEFKDRVQKEIDLITEELKLSPIKCEILSEAWRDG